MQASDREAFVDPKTGILLRPARREDVHHIFRFIKGLAEYEKLSGVCVFGVCLCVERETLGFTFTSAAEEAPIPLRYSQHPLLFGCLCVVLC